MKTLILLLALILVPITAHAENLEKPLVENILNGTVRIVNYQEGSVVGSGVGAGVIVSESGLILTNYHVIHKAVKLKVFLWKDRRRHAHIATVIGTDPIADLALIDIDPWTDEKFRPIELETGIPNIHAGAEVIAVGHPLSLQWSVTRGIINAVNRHSFLSPYVFLIQHDAVINEGNSGGPLFNGEGKLVGINTYMIKPENSYSGMGYAVQIDSVAKSLTGMMEFGMVIRPALKLNVIPLNDDVREFIRAEEEPDPYLPNTFGVIMNFISEEQEAKGLQNWDVIVSIDGFPINDMRDIASVMYGKLPNDLIYLMINRRGEYLLQPFVLGTLELPDDYYDKRGMGNDTPDSEDEKPSNE
jgi:serine protease Do